MRGVTKDSRAAQLSWVQWMLGWPGIALAFVWGLAEGTLFFVVPDVLLSLAALFGPREVPQDGGKEKRGKVRRPCPALRLLRSG